jgi:GTP-binding protein
MHITSSNFVTSAVKLSQYPPDELSEFAFAGRSNAGKSSMINALLNRKRLVKISSTPGKTQLINFFLINDAFMFVDLPGFGYAKVPKAVKKTWGNMVETYLKQRQYLKGLVLLMDIRRLPRQEELDLLGWLDLYCLPAVIVLTKADKLSKSKQKHQQNAIAKTLGVSSDRLLIFSAKTRQGKDALWRAINFYLNQPNGSDSSGPLDNHL